MDVALPVNENFLSGLLLSEDKTTKISTLNHYKNKQSISVNIFLQNCFSLFKFHVDLILKILDENNGSYTCALEFFLLLISMLKNVGQICDLRKRSNV